MALRPKVRSTHVEGESDLDFLRAHSGATLVSLIDALVTKYPTLPARYAATQHRLRLEAAARKLGLAPPPPGS